MKNLRSNSLLKILSTLFVCTALSAAFISCDPVVESGFSSEEEALAALDGTFVSSSVYGTSTIIIDFENSTYTDKFNDSVSYAGDEMTVVFTSKDYTAGYIYIKYTENIYYDGVNGKYYAIAFKDLTTTSLSYSGAYKADGVTSTETLDEAKNEFTTDNGYYGKYTEAIKQ